jgi:putative nucleotidyltransferase-like protein
MNSKAVSRVRWDVAQLLCRLASGWLEPTAPVALPSNEAWEPLIEAASSQLVTPALSFALRGRIDVPQRVADYLDGVLFLNRERNESILGELATILRVLNATGIAPVLMKGAASLVSALYPDPGMRIVSDIDLLLTESQAEEAVRLLAGLGLKSLQSKRVNYSQHHHLAPQYDPRTGLVVEVHIRPLIDQWGAFLDARSMMKRAHRIAFAEGVTFIPDPTDRVIHNIVHNQLSDQNYARHRLDVRQMLELAALVHRYNAELDWPALRRTFKEGGQLTALQDTLEIIAELFGVSPDCQIGVSGNRPLHDLQSEFQRSDLKWLFDRFLTAARTRPLTVLRALRPHAWGRLFKALRHDMRSERW